MATEKNMYKGILMVTVSLDQDMIPFPVTTFHEYARHTCSQQTPASLALTH